MELRLYLRMLQKGWWIILVTALAALNGALLLSYVSPPVYSASARFFVSPNPDIVKASDVLNSLSTLDKRSIISTYSEFLRSTRIFREAVADLGVSASELSKYTLDSVVLPDANILEISAKGPDPRVATAIVNAVGQRGISIIKQYYQVYDISFLDPAEVPTSPISPQPVRDSGLALALGVIIGATLAILSEQIRIPLDSYRQQRIMDSASMAFNRKHFQHSLEDALASHPNNILSLAIIQLDGLKGLIDTLPQPFVQRLMRQVVDVLRKELRGNDLIGRWDTISFAVILPATPGDAAVRTLGRIRKALEQPFLLASDGERLALNPQLGIAVYQGKGSVQDLIQRVESAIEQAQIHNTDGVMMVE